MFQTLIHKLDAPVVLTGAALRSAAAVRAARQPRPLHTDHGGGGGFTAPPTPTPSLSSVKSSLEQPRPTRHHHFHTSALLAGPAGNWAGKESLEFHNVETAFAGVPTYNLVRAGTCTQHTIVFNDLTSLFTSDVILSLSSLLKKKLQMLSNMKLSFPLLFKVDAWLHTYAFAVRYFPCTQHDKSSSSFLVLYCTDKS